MGCEEWGELSSIDLCSKVFVKEGKAEGTLYQWGKSRKEVMFTRGTQSNVILMKEFYEPKM